jgi:hypothetical protein
MRNPEEEGICYHLKDISHMQTTAHRLASLWTKVRTQPHDSQDPQAAQAAFTREPASYSSPEFLNELGNVACHRI